MCNIFLEIKKIRIILQSILEKLIINHLIHYKNDKS